MGSNGQVVGLQDRNIIERGRESYMCSVAFGAEEKVWQIFTSNHLQSYLQPGRTVKELLSG